MATSKRVGQRRFEAWVPKALYDEFSHRIPNRSAWLRAQMAAAVGGEAHECKRVQVGTRYSLGQLLPVWQCSTCGKEMG